jgi:hypothetical protein
MRDNSGVVKMFPFAQSCFHACDTTRTQRSLVEIKTVNMLAVISFLEFKDAITGVY